MLLREHGRSLLFDHFFDLPFKYTPQERELGVDNVVGVGNAHGARYLLALRREGKGEHGVIPLFFINSHLACHVGARVDERLLHARNCGVLIRAMW